MRNPVNAGYECPFINSQCIKRSQKIEGPYPICSIYQGGGTARSETVSAKQICVCPKRFFEADFLQDVLDHCWVGPAPKNPQIAHEVKMAGFGTVDFVIADVEPGPNVHNFLSVELQAIDITGTCEPAYQAVLNKSMLDKRPSYGLNWANVHKRYVSQLISKGFFHHHWNTRIVAVVQDYVYEYLQQNISFPEMQLKDSNVVFMLYKFADAPDKGPGHKCMVFDRIAPTNHNSLMSGILYRTPPSKDDFCKRILGQLAKS